MTQSHDPDVTGFAAPGFEPVRQAFERNFTEFGEVGASCAVYVDGDKKVDLWGGVADLATERPWAEDTVGLVYSVTKGATAILCNLLAERGELDLDAPVARYWPEFAVNGKSGIPVRMILDHQAGLPALEERLPLREILADGVAAGALAKQTPLWSPGSSFGYHALTFGWLLEEIVQRATGRSIRDLMATEVARPLSVDFSIGLPDEQRHRVATLVNGPVPSASLSDLFTRVLTTNGVLPAPDADTWNDPAVRRAVLPAANGFTNARSVARLYASCVGEVDGFRLLGEEAVADATAEQSVGQDRVTALNGRFGTGFMLPTTGTPMLSETSFGHEGVGGALGFADRGARMGFGYVPNLLMPGLSGDPRVLGLLTALRDSLQLEK
jgi:CubicO group peptidase (beta-lactamase class C family)